MRILFVTPYYFPDLGPSAPMITRLCEDLARAGHAVTVIAAVPHFPDGHVKKEYRRGVWQWSNENNVRVCRVRVPDGNRNRLFHRLLVFAIFQILASLASLRVKYDLALITNPAIETFLPFFAGWIRCKPILFSVWDIYPDVGIQLGLFRSSLTVKLIQFLEHFCLRRSARIQTLSERMAFILRARAPEQTPVDVIPVWLDADAYAGSTRHNAFSKQHSLDDSFVVMYSGNMGYSQGLENALAAAGMLQDHPGIQFIFIGDGAQRNALEQAAKNMNLANTRFLPFQPRDIFYQALASADLAIVSQQAQVSASSLPSKIFTWMAAGKPILAFAEKDSDLFHLLVNEDAGECVNPFDVGKFADRILQLQMDDARCSQMGANGRACVLRDHTRSIACGKFEYLFQQLVKPTP